MKIDRGRQLVACAAIIGAMVGTSVLASVSANAATTCSSAYDAGKAYTAGNTASENGVNYTANWWTQGQDPAHNNGGAGSGQPWTSNGACTGGTSPGGGTNPGGGTGGGTNTGGGTGSAGGLLFSPYKDVTVNMNWNTDAMQTAVTGSAQPVTTAVPRLKALSLAFATGQCGSENWGGVPGANFASANVPALDAAGIDYVVSTGGQAGTFSCASAAALDGFIARYSSPHLVGIDFDIEGGQTAADITNLVNAAVGAQSAYPKLRFSFTLATLAASDGSFGGLNGLGAQVVNTVKASRLSNYTINLMTMDYGTTTSTAVCVVAGGTCDMGRSAVQAALNLEHGYGIPASKIELTPMIGVNDASSEKFTVADAATVVSWAKANGIAGVHFWSLDRDTPCASTTASATCSSTSTAALGYTDAFLNALG